MLPEALHERPWVEVLDFRLHELRRFLERQQLRVNILDREDLESSLS